MIAPVFNNLVMFDQHVKQSSLNSIVPDLARGWTWNEEGTAVTFPLRQGVRWHDGKPFTAKDVQCTWDLLIDGSAEKLRLNPRKTWYSNLEEPPAESRLRTRFMPTFPVRFDGAPAPVTSSQLLGEHTTQVFGD